MAFRAASLSSGRIVPRRYCRLFKATTAYTSASTDAGEALAPLLSGGTRVHHWKSARRLWPDTRRLQLPLDDCCRLVLPYNAVHSIQQTEQTPNDPPRIGAKSTTTSNHPSTSRKSKIAKQRDGEQQKGHAKLRKGAVKLRKGDEKQRMVGSARLRNNERAMRNNNKVMRNYETAKQRDCETMKGRCKTTKGRCERVRF